MAAVLQRNINCEAQGQGNKENWKLRKTGKCKLCVQTVQTLCSCFDAEIFKHSSFGKVVSLRRRQGAKEAVSFNYLFVERAVVKVMEKIQIKPHSCIHAGKVQCVVKLSSAG